MAMAAFMDELRSNPKHLRMRKHPLAKLLWYDVIVACNEALTDGLVPDYLLDRWAYDCGIETADDLKACTDVLVALDRWHDHETIKGCPDCYEEAGDIEAGFFYVHDYLVHQPRSNEVKDPLERKRWRRKKQLHRNKELCTAIRERDHDRCRYCGDEVNFLARSGPLAGTYDHINPNDFGSNEPGDKDGGNALHKVVVACSNCNSKFKRNRTPEEAGMELLPAPKDYDVATGEVLAGPSRSWPVPSPGPGQDQDPTGKAGPEAGSGQGSRAPARETGPGRDGPGTGRGGARTGRAGPGGAGTPRDRAGSGRRGPGKAGGGPSRAGKGRAAGSTPSPTATESNAADRSPTTDARTTP